MQETLEEKYNNQTDTQILCLTIAPIVCGHSGTKYSRTDLEGVGYCPTRNSYGPSVVENSPYLFDQLTRKRSRTNSSSMDDDMEEDDESGFHGNNNRSPGSQGSTGWEVDQGISSFSHFSKKKEMSKSNVKKKLFYTLIYSKSFSLFPNTFTQTKD